MGTCACGRRCQGSMCADCKRDADWEDTFRNTDFGEEDEEKPDVLTDGGVDQRTDGTEHPFDVAAKNDQRVNEMLADTDGVICTMEYDGAIGYHINVAKGETDPEYLWKIALLQALDESVFEMMYVDAGNARDARAQIERELEDSFNLHTAEYVADVFEDKLADLIEVQEDRSSDSDADQDLVTDGGQQEIPSGGAIDHEFEDNERSAEAQLREAVEGIQTEPMAGGVAIDLVTRQPLFVRRVVAESITAYYEAEEFDLYSYKTHPYLPVRLDDPVYECVYISGNPEGAHKAGNTYDFPRGRLMHVPVEEAWSGGDPDA